LRRTVPTGVPRPRDIDKNVHVSPVLLTARKITQRSLRWTDRYLNLLNQGQGIDGRELGTRIMFVAGPRGFEPRTFACVFGALYSLFRGSLRRLG